MSRRAELVAELTRLAARQGEVLAELAALEGLPAAANDTAPRPPPSPRRPAMRIPPPPLNPPSEIDRQRVAAELERLPGYRRTRGPL